VSGSSCWAAAMPASQPGTLRRAADLSREGPRRGVGPMRPGAGVLSWIIDSTNPPGAATPPVGFRSNRVAAGPCNPPACRAVPRRSFVPNRCLRPKALTLGTLCARCSPRGSRGLSSERPGGRLDEPTCCPAALQPAAEAGHAVAGAAAGARRLRAARRRPRRPAHAQAHAAAHRNRFRPPSAASCPAWSPATACPAGPTWRPWSKAMPRCGAARSPSPPTGSSTTSPTTAPRPRATCGSTRPATCTKARARTQARDLRGLLQQRALPVPGERGARRGQAHRFRRRQRVGGPRATYTTCRREDFPGLDAGLAADRGHDHHRHRRERGRGQERAPELHGHQHAADPERELSRCRTRARAACCRPPSASTTPTASRSRSRTTGTSRPTATPRSRRRS
jgi:hypothetical protein